MQQRQPRLGDVLDDYCPRERRLTNHVVVAMIGEDVKQTRCTTCDADHEYKHARIPRQRRKGEMPVIAAPVAAAPKRVTHEVPAAPAPELAAENHLSAEDQLRAALGISTVETQTATDVAAADLSESRDDGDEPLEDGPAHRRLIRAQLPKHEGQQSTQRQAPDFTIRQPTGGRPGGRFRPRHPRAAVPFQGNRNGGPFNGNQRGGGPRPQGGGGGGPRQGGKRHK